MKHVIIGNGIAGVCAAEAIREIRPDDEIVMIGDENVLPYGRPLISHVLEGCLVPEKLLIRPPDFYRRLNITPVLGRRAAGLDINARTVMMADGAPIGFDRLLVATGADPRRLNVPGSQLANIFCLRTQADVRQQLAALGQGARRALVLGGGLVGFKAAYGLVRRGLDVTMLIGSGYPLSMQVDETAGKMILAEMQAHGFTVQVGLNVAAFEGRATVQAALTDAGTRIACDMVIVGKGVTPAHGFLAGLPIGIDSGILVDAHLQTRLPQIYAAGDVAETVDIARQRRWVNAIWPEAALQGKIAGFNMAGRPVAYRGSLGRNVLRIFGLDVMSLGDPCPQSPQRYRILHSGGPGRGFYRSLVLKDDRLVGAVLINGIEQGGVLRALIENRVPLRRPAADLMSPGFNFSRLLHG
jgi:NAD(P)H-nitrite reductase large subunit